MPDQPLRHAAVLAAPGSPEAICDALVAGIQACRSRRGASAGSPGARESPGRGVFYIGTMVMQAFGELQETSLGVTSAGVERVTRLRRLKARVPEPRVEETRRGEEMNKVTPFMMFDQGMEQAIEFYTSTFPDSEVRNVSRNGKDGPITSAEFVIGGQFFMGYNGGPHFRFSEAFSLFVTCEDQAEVDEYWDAIIAAGGKPTQCGWINDPWGVSWQIVPKRFMELMADRDPKKVKAVVDAMLEMVKLDVAALEAAYDDA